MTEAAPTRYAIPRTCLVVLVGVSGSGKSAFAAQHFGPFETLSSDRFRGMVGNDESDQAATADAFDALQHVAAIRLARGLLTVVDATSVQPESRRRLIGLAKAHDVLPVAIVLDVPEAVAVERNARRTDRDIPAQVVRRQSDQLRRGLRGLGREGFRRVHVLSGVEQIEAATFVREPLLNDRTWDTGPFDAIGDVHGCLGELEALLARLDYLIVRDDAGRAIDAAHPDGRTAVLLGDVVDRGPDVVGALRLVMGMVGSGHALMVQGNHEDKLVKALRGAKVQTGHGLAETLAQLEAEGPEFRQRVLDFCSGLVAHLVLDEGRLVVAHAGLKEQYQGRASGRVRSFALYGETTGETDEFGLPVRSPWAQDYRGEAAVLYGHTPVPAVEWVNGTACLDTGAVFGGALSAMRYPEREVVSVPAQQVWYEPVRPLVTPGTEREPGRLRLEDVQGKLLVETGTHGRITVREEQTAGGLEVMSRWAVDPRRLLYIPPTMSPPNASAVPGFLEHPAEAFRAYRDAGVTDVLCEEKHMGSRAVVLVARDPARFALPPGSRGLVHTRTGRPFFDDAEVEARVLAELDGALETAGIWAELDADWVLLDAELLPWSLKAGALIRDLYASVAASGLTATTATAEVLRSASARGLDVGDLAGRIDRRRDGLGLFRDAYRRHVGDAGAVRLAPFQVLAAGSTTFEERDHGWHLGIADRLAAAAPDLVQPTRRLRADLTDESSVAAAVDWWLDLTAAGGEGMVVKPFANLTRTAKGAAQPGIKVRGREYLRIIYGPDSTDEANLTRLRERDTGHKRSLAAREYALGLEGLRRFAAGEPLWRVHEAVFATLALESDPIDPRL
ncbi:polynucleotide kinase-phosphatase [uncultured Amnibacterium sp.]|uniref:polynucleotide kinase-phosphatase n=1 Tax=uncultured Amnibacterium sp. TaxID=1631851 RepID=UPI0035CB8B30